MYRVTAKIATIFDLDLNENNDDRKQKESFLLALQLYKPTMYIGKTIRRIYRH